MDAWSRRLTVGPGFIGAAVIALGALVTALPYVGSAQEPYSPFNHFVSELGDTQESALAGLFSVGLVIGGLAFALFMIGVGLRFQGVMRYAFAIGGALVGISGALVGVLPMDVDPTTHGLVALLFLEGSLVLLVLFSMYVALARQAAYPGWLALVALPMIVSNAVFVVLVRNSGTGALAAPVGERDPFVLITTSEWGVVIFLLAWVTTIATWRARQSD
jgi:uncharacterized membrane protein YciS (DUF1049 family)